MFEDFKKYEEFEPAGLELPKITLDKKLLSNLNLSEGCSSLEVLKSLARKGIKEKEIDKLPNKKEYYDRAKYEIDTFEELGFVDYVLLNWEVVSYAKGSNFAVGDGRGSAPSSLILYLLGITNKDPIPSSLFFERFVSKNRAKKIVDKNGKEFIVGSLAPDVDTDVSNDDREDVVKFIEEKHEGRTSKILTFNTFSSKLCIKECAKFFGKVSDEESNKISDLIPKQHGIVLPLKKAYEESSSFKDWCDHNKDIYERALLVEDLNKNTGVHPSGIAICSQKIDDVIPLQKSKDDKIISGYDMNDVADLMVKFDILGLRTLSIANKACQKIGISLDDIDEEDPFIYDCLQNFEHPCGLFQISADTNAEVTKRVKPSNLSELSDVVALARPAALQFVDDYIGQKAEQSDLGLHPVLDELVKETKNTILFQETLMQIGHKVFGFTLDEAEMLRRDVGKKKVDKIGLWRTKIYNSAEKKGIKKEVADYYWRSVEAAGSYAFNKCLSPDSVIKTIDGKKTLQEIKVGESVLAFDVESETNHHVEVLNIHSNETELFEVELENGSKVKCSMDHKFLTEKGMMPLKRILEEDLGILSDPSF